MTLRFSRRRFLEAGAVVAASGALRGRAAGLASESKPLEEVGYGQVTMTSAPHLAQMENVRSVLMGLDEDSLLRPFRAMSGQAAPGATLGGWYEYVPSYDNKLGGPGFAPSATFGQWVSALSRMYAISGDQALREKVLRLNQLYARTISTAQYENTRFPAYDFDKIVCGLKDSHRLAGDENAFAILGKTAAAAKPVLPGHAVEHGAVWRPGKDVSYTWDESYTLPENLYLISAQMGAAGAEYRRMAEAYLDDATYFDPLARGENVLGGRHAYSYVNALCSAMQAYMVGGSEMHLRAARNAFDMLQAQSFATGGWGPDEELRKPGSHEVYASLAKSHSSFETPCGSYAHMKLTRYLLRVTREGRYGDSMERVMYNTVMGSLPLQADGRAFYYSDYCSEGAVGHRVYSTSPWPCCSGTLPQVVADYWINGYFREPGAVWVNLYMPSKLRWDEDGSKMEMELTGSYPEAEDVRLRVTAARPTSFALKLRIPAWADGATVQVNGKPVEMRVTTGFATLRRTWQNGDVVEVKLPMRLRAEVLDAAHPETVALMYGPRVLFALSAEPVAASRGKVLAARQVNENEWAMQGEKGEVRMVPFTAVGDRAYATYLQVSA